MKKIVLFLLLVTGKVYAKSSLEMNVFTEHLFVSCEAAERFSNKVWDCGNLINNAVIGINTEINNDISVRGFLGENSVGYPLIGGAISKIGFAQGLSFSPVIGGYIQDNRPFTERGLTAMTLKYKNIDFVPILGVESQYKINNFKVFSILIPAFVTLGIGIDF